MNYPHHQQPTSSVNTPLYRFENGDSKHQWAVNAPTTSNHSANPIHYRTNTPTTANMYYSNTNNTSHIPLQEPVAFEDFQFSLGLDPEFAMPVPLDIPPPPPPSTSNTSFIDIQNSQHQQRSFMQAPEQSGLIRSNNTQEYIPNGFPANSDSASSSNVILDENEQKAFKQWLDQFFSDSSMQATPTFNEYQHKSPQHKDVLMTEPVLDGANLSSPPASERSASADKNALNTSFDKHHRTESNNSNDSSSSMVSGSRHDRSSSSNKSAGGAIRRGQHKELLTEEEKRNNHIASEQKRRSMIRSGFKNLTDIVPTLSKSANNSKSTILFKAVDYIKHLEKRNNQLRNRLKQLEFRAQVESKIKIEETLTATTTTTAAIMSAASAVPTTSPTASNTAADSVALKKEAEAETVEPSTATFISDSTDSALRLHKYQQRQLRELQEKLQLHQQLLTQRNSSNNNSDSNDNIVTA